MKTEIILPEEWLTHELFNFLVINSVISQDEEFEDWKYNRTDMLNMVKNELENGY